MGSWKYCILALFLVSTRLAAADDHSLSLAEALSRADKHNADLQAATENAAAAMAQGQAARRLAWPRLAVESTWTRTNNPGIVFGQKLSGGDLTQEDFLIDNLLSPGAWNHLSSSAAIEIPLDLFGRIGAMAGAQEAGGRASQAAAHEARQEIRLRVTETYLRAGLAHRVVDVTEHAVAVAKAREAEMRARVSEGAALPADRLRATARRREREAELATRRGQERVALAALARLVGADPGTTYVPSDPPPTPEPLSLDEAAWVERALAQRPLVTAHDQAVQAARWAARAEQRSTWPQLGVVAQVSDDRSAVSGGAQAAMIGLRAHWDAVDMARSRRSAAARARLRAAEQAARAASQQVRLEVQMAYRSAAAAIERQAAAAGGAAEAREAFRVIQERRQAGLATLTDELETETAAMAAALGEISAAADVAIAQATLRRASGEL